MLSSSPVRLFRALLGEVRAFVGGDGAPSTDVLKGPALRARRRRIERARHLVQGGFLLTVLWIGWEFVRWVRGLEAGPVVGERPPGVEGFRCQSMGYWQPNVTRPLAGRIEKLLLVVAARLCWSGRSEADDFMKFSLSSSGCESRPTKAEPGRSVASLAAVVATRRLMRRQASTRAVGMQPRKGSSREAQEVTNSEGSRRRHRYWARGRLPRRGGRPRHV